MIDVVLAVAAAALAVSQPIPQIVRLVRTRSVAGVSGATTWLGLAVNLAWAGYGVGRSLPLVIALSAVYSFGYLVTAVLLVRNGQRRGIAAGAAAAAGFVGLGTAAGLTTLGTVLALVVGVQFLPQIVEAWRSDDLTALAPGTYLVAAADGAIWGIYGSVVADGPLVLYGVVMLSVAVLVLVPRRRWARNAARATAAAAPAPSAGPA